MKKLIIIITLFIIKEDVSAQHLAKIDSVKVYTKQYYGTGPHLNQYDIMYSGDSVLITDYKIAVQFYNNLYAMKKKSTKYNLRKIRNDFTPESINVRAVFVFYNNSKMTVIGISPQPLMFIGNKVFEKKDIKLERIVKPYAQLYKNLFPTKEEILNKN